jgi:hypothetical protein
MSSTLGWTLVCYAVLAAALIYAMRGDLRRWWAGRRGGQRG